MKVYVVTQGSYSDYHIEQVFLEREKAELYCKLHDTSGWGDHPELEEYDTYDDFVEEEKKSIKYLYSFKLDERGNIKTCYKEILDQIGYEWLNKEPWELPGKLKLSFRNDYPCVDKLIEVTANIVTNEIDDNKAIKIVEDYLAEYYYMCVEAGITPPWQRIEEPSWKVNRPPITTLSVNIE